MNMRRRDAFTLIELLVVISISVLLMAMLLPALQRVKRQAKAVACQSNLHQWAIIFELYAGENDGYFWSGDMHRGGWKQYCWIYPLQPYHRGDTELRFCPTATKLRVDGAYDPFAAWGPVPQTQNDCSSYGMNNWVCNPLPEVKFIHGREAAEDNWRNVYVEGAANIPLFLDCAFVEGKPYHFDVPPEYDGDIATWGVSALQMKRFCLNRHDGYINSVFLDFSIRKIGLKELWTLKWHRQFNTAGPWTRAGGVKPEDWPHWMRGLKDY
jgi:prepilin-type N-terminal cleavage/methylation domain-containing protein